MSKVTWFGHVVRRDEIESWERLSLLKNQVGKHLKFLRKEKICKRNWQHAGFELKLVVDYH